MLMVWLLPRDTTRYKGVYCVHFEGMGGRLWVPYFSMMNGYVKRSMRSMRSLFKTCLQRVVHKIFFLLHAIYPGCLNAILRDLNQMLLPFHNICFSCSSKENSHRPSTKIVQRFSLHSLRSS
ncbi:hypothetical protein EYC80_001350 [Monilinia laxa]|nr:hypothetical protein EYC80_001350 [Monilinia laxa]